MTNLRLPNLFLALFSLALLPLFFCVNRAVADPGLTIGVGPDSRQQIISELIILLLEQEGVPVTSKRGMTGAQLRPLLIRGEIDLYFPPLPAKPLPEQGEIKLLRLPPLSVTSGPALIMRGKEARDLKIETISQLAELVKANPQKFHFDNIAEAHRKRLLTTYGLPISIGQPLPASLLYRSLKIGRVDVALGRGDDGRITAFRLIALTDDRLALPNLQPTPLMRKGTLDKFPAIATTIKRLGEHLDTKAMRRLHGGVIIAHRQPRAVAREWLRKRNLL